MTVYIFMPSDDPRVTPRMSYYRPVRDGWIGPQIVVPFGEKPDVDGVIVGGPFA